MPLQEFSFNLFVVTILATIGMVAAALTRQVRVVVGRNRLSSLEARNQKLQKKQEDLSKQFDAQKEDMRQTEEDRRILVNQIHETKRRQKMAEQDNFEIVHEVGEPGGSRRLFIGALTLGPTLTVAKVVTTESKLRGVRHTLEVWSDDAGEATRTAKLTFPSDQGYQVQNLSAANQAQVAAQ